ncbi:sensor histidine kinase [Xylanimonas oleitrophica]|uniref:Sensor histidine kinase n=1 Tax=Xylanimonas oleitrophica TaxID=2607479 RepID=A0A2W5WMY9_9MICO|nr:sensor histidine kinase [Xylanimonas oleitrophica]PZR52113.1 sensor histidine kinase [Xylanimonas oleitrophica]
MNRVRSLLPAAPSLPGGVRGVETYTRVSLYGVALVELPLVLTAVSVLLHPETAGGSQQGLARTVLVLGVAHTLACLATLRVDLDRRPLTDRFRQAALVALGGTTLALVVLALAALPSGGQPFFQEDARSAVLITVGTFTVGTLAVVVPFRRLLWCVLAAGLLAGAGKVAAGAAQDALGIVLGALFFAFALAGTVRLSVWILDVVRALDAARDAEARLAVAEERLRISRDMHDVVGRALSAVAVKSELAAELARRGDERAVTEMLAVRVLAQDSLSETRELVARYRAPDLATELVGARSLLTSAGIATRVVGDAAVLPPHVQDTLAWAVREAVTNVVRHTEASTCLLEIADDGDGVLLRVVNDGVRPDPPGEDDAERTVHGSGLAGLRERLAGVHGTLSTRRDGPRFVLEARVPVQVDETTEVAP